MTISVQIHPSSSSLFMFNEPEASTAYSLSGHVSIAISPSQFCFDRSRPAKAILRSLTLTFEGYQELVTHETGYTATRLCSFTRELAPVEAMLLSSDGREDAKSAVWNFVFDIPVPGWLPSTSTFGSDLHGGAGTRYALFAEARFASFGEGHSRGWSLAALCSSLSPRDRVVHAKRCDVEITRFMQPELEVDEDKPFGDITYAIDSQSDRPVRTNGDPTRIPEEILRKIEVLATVPETVTTDADDLKLAVRLRASGLPIEQQRRLRLTDFEIKLTQTEHYHKSPQPSYVASFPLPDESMQTERKPLLNPHPTKSMYDIGLITAAMTNPDANSFSSSFSLLPKRHSGRHRLPKRGVTFAHDSAREDEIAWCKLEVAVPFSHVQINEDSEWERSYGRVKALRPTEETPLFCVHHELEVDLTCVYDSDVVGEKPATERLVFSVPVTFACVPPRREFTAKDFLAIPALSSSPAFLSSPIPSRSASPSPSTASSSCASPSYNEFNSLPAYSQLYHPNGDRKINYSIPLPLYTPKERDPSEAPPYEQQSEAHRFVDAKSS